MGGVMMVMMMMIQSFPFGWEDAADGFRGHVFTNPANTTVVLSIKGTTLQGPTSKKDKFNDNLLFSCCCAGWTSRGCLAPCATATRSTGDATASV